MKSFRAGPLLVHAAGGPDRSGGGDGPAVILCHGFGAPGTDLVSLQRVVDAGSATRWFFPEAPLELDLGWGQSGRAWWPIDMMRYQRRIMEGRGAELIDEVPDGLTEARVALDATLDALASQHGVQASRTLLGGFSQGAMLTTDRALHATERYAGLVVLSGAMIARTRWDVAITANASGLEVFQSHGRMDPILPFPGAEVLREKLTTAGAKVTWTPFQGQHEIPGVVVDGLGAFARRRLEG